MPAMQFLAKIRKGSAVHRLWQAQSRLGGELQGVPFKWSITDFAYASTRPLEPTEVALLERHDSVQIAMIGASTGAVTVKQPEPEPEPPEGDDELPARRRGGRPLRKPGA
jgi:hypothetical protein